MLSVIKLSEKSVSCVKRENVTSFSTIQMDGNVACKTLSLVKVETSSLRPIVEALLSSDIERKARR